MTFLIGITLELLYLWIKPTNIITMTNAIKKNGVNFGIILGVYLILVTAIMYVVDLKLFLEWWIGTLNFVISLGIGIVAVSKSKKALGGLITFKEAFTAFFITMAIGVTMNVLFNAVLFNVIDPGAKETLKQHLLEFTVATMQKFDTPSEILKTTIEEMQNDDNFGFVAQIKSLVWSLLFYAIAGLLVALVFKNKAKDTL